MTLKVIGTGFGRTGTDSMRKALNALGVGPTHHMMELQEGSAAYQGWVALAKGAEPDWSGLFAGFSACVDWPSAYYWHYLVERYPDAKVLLTNRSAESWWESFRHTILQHILSGSHPDGLAQQLIAEQVFNGKPDDRSYAISVYKNNVDEVVATIDSERLLVHNLGDGWPPLCKWLDLPIPDIDYPKGNSTEQFVRNVFGAAEGS